MAITGTVQAQRRIDKWPFRCHVMAMSSYSVAQAKNNLGQLIDRALAGEPVVITRRGTPVIEFKPVVRRPCVTAEDLEWLRQQREKLPKIDIDSGEFVSQMRDEEWNR